MNTKLAFLPGSKLRKIAHLADIHIRLFKRHTEYREAFQTLYNDLRKKMTNPTEWVIVVAGDIVHAKTDLSPEMVEVTSEFLRNLADIAPTLVIAGNHDCFTSDHELLTDCGWVFIDDVVNKNVKVDKIATWNSETCGIEWHTPTAYIKRRFNGSMRQLSGPNVDLCVTPTHNIVYYHHASKSYYKRTAQEIPTTAMIPLTGIAVTSYDTWCELIGFTKADGTLVIKNPATGTGRVQFRLKKERKISYLRLLLKSLAISYTERNRDDVTIICIYGEAARRILTEFGYDKSKPLGPEWYMRSAPEQRGLLQGFFSGDGHHHGNSFYSAVTIDRSCAELITTLARLVGATSHIGELRSGSGYTNGKLQTPFTVKLDVGESFGSLENITDIPYDGDVFCVSVPTQNLLVRRNGKIVITGNCNLSNSSRLDSLTPIIQNIKHSELHYLKHSGVYSIGDVDFAVHSIIGDSAQWPTPPDCPSSNRIALFHGPVYSATTDVGFTITSRHHTLDIFDGYDMVLLGDIHRHQVLQDCSPKDGKPVVVYSSSLIQQNHGETLVGHGWCEWDIESRSFQFHELKNTHGYYTLRIKDGKVTKKDIAQMPQNVYLRIFAGDMDQAQIKKLVAKIRTERNIIECSVSSFDGAKKNTDGVVANTFLDIHDVSYQNKLLTDYLTNAMPNLSQDALDRVLALNKEKNSEISADELARNVVWKPISLKYDNLFTYGENNSINFDTLHGVVGIFAPNASGKTSIAEAICFALFDKTPRTQKAVNIMNTRKDTCYCELVFEINGTRYTIERTGTRDKKGAVKIDVDFYTHENGKKKSLNGEERRYTNKNIVGYVGDFEEFLLTTFSSSSQQGLFLDRGQSDRKDLLSQFMGLNIFDKLHTLANDESKEIAGALKRFKNDDFTQALVDVQDEICGEELNLPGLEAQVSDNQQHINTIDKAIQDEYAAKTPINFTSPDLETLEKKAETARETYARGREEIKTMTDDLGKLNDLIARAKEKLITFDGVEDEYKKYTDLTTDQYKAESNIRFYESSLSHEKRQYDAAAAYKYDPNCQFCVENGQTAINVAAEMGAKVERSKALLLEWNTTLETIKRQIDILGGVDERYKKLHVGREFVVSKDRDATRLRLKISTLDAQLQQLEMQWTEADRQIIQFLGAQDIIKENEACDQRIQAHAAQKEHYRSELAIASRNLAKAKTDIALLNQRKQDMLAKIKEAEELEATYEAYDAYLTAVCRDGLPYKLIADVLPMIQTAVNEILAQMVEFTLLFETDGKNINMRIRYDEDRIWPSEMASGMEKFLISMAIRVALSSLSSLPKSNFLIVDEGFGTLDADNMASVSMMFDVLRTKFDFMLLISHIDEIRDVADTHAEIKRDKGFSQIQVH